jgi:two-component system nitrate/nitrite response regulator NarL
VTQVEQSERRADVAISCVLADGHPAVLAALSRLLAAHGVSIVATASDGVAALEAIREHAPAVAIVDLKIDRLSGIEITRTIGTQTAVILYTSYRDRLSLHDALDAGARALVLKEAPLDDVVQAIQTVLAGRIYLDPLLAGVVTAPDLKALSPRERSVLRRLADGQSSEAIGEALSIAPDTVRAHVRNAMRKLGVETRTQAVAEALRRSLID